MAQYKQKLNTRTGAFNLVPSTIIVFKASVANYAALPALGNEIGDARITEDSDHWYSWDGSAWNDQGIFIASNWENINGRPSSAVADIDDAVSKKHDGTVQANRIRGTFVNGDLVAGKLTVTHNFGLSAPYIVSVLLFNDSNEQIVPDGVIGAANSVEIDLTSYGILSNTYGYLIIS